MQLFQLSVWQHKHCNHEWCEHYAIMYVCAPTKYLTSSSFYSYHDCNSTAAYDHDNRKLTMSMDAMSYWSKFSWFSRLSEKCVQIISHSHGLQGSVPQKLWRNHFCSCAQRESEKMNSLSILTQTAFQTTYVATQSCFRRSCDIASPTNVVTFEANEKLPS